jgi:hypothetical protein
MLVVGLLSTEQEAEELKYIAGICDIEDRVHFLVRMQRIKEMLKNEPKN